MPRDYPRSERLGSQIQRELAELIRLETRDPGLAMVSILDVQVSRDLSHASVYFSVLDADLASDCIAALARANGFLQRQIGQRLKTRITPKLDFIYDDTDVRGRELTNLIDAALADDQQKSER